MDLFFVDDAMQLKPSRDGMNSPLKAMGGIHVPDESVGALEHAIESTCKEYGFPDEAVFKWSPGRDDAELWMHNNLTGNKRQEFFTRILKIAKVAEAKAMVVIEDTSCKTATSAKERDVDLLNLFLERANLALGNEGCHGIVICSQPSGNRKNEHKFLADCVKTLRYGTDYTNFEHIPLSILSASHKFIRLLQLADIVTSCTTAFVAGESKHSPQIFKVIKQILVRHSDRIGGVGLKIHPDLKYANLYHWLLDDKIFYKGDKCLNMPLLDAPYSASPDTQ